MPVAKVNVVSCPLEDELDEHGFAHRETILGPRLGSERIGGSVYEAYEGIPIWPFHYHYGVEEWIYVIDGSPVLRDLSARRELSAGDLVCFPSGHLGAHAIDGPGRFILFSDETTPPVMSVYPDSDKLAAVPSERDGPRFDRIMVPRDAAVDYWYDEGDGGRRERGYVVRQPDDVPSQPVANVLQSEGPLGQGLGARLLEATVCEIPAGGCAAPYHYVHGREEWLLVLRGQAVVRHPGGSEGLAAGEATCFNEGPAGARQVMAGPDQPARVLLLTNTSTPANVCYPDAGTWRLLNRAGDELVVHGGDTVSLDQG